MNNITAYCLTLLLCPAVFTARAATGDRLTGYIYEDTRQLVMLVEEAAALIEQQGPAAFSQFQQRNSRWLNDKHYLFVYTTNGICAFHPIEPELVGQNLLGLKDIDNRSAIRLITEVAGKPGPDAAGWVFYRWEDPWRSSFPQWKTSYVRKAIAPDGAVYLVGCGLGDMKIEKVFIEQQVDQAAGLMMTLGPQAALQALRDRSESFDIRDSSLLVMNSEGAIVFSPNFPSLRLDRNLRHMVDMTGKPIGEQALNALAQRDRAWLSYIWPMDHARRLARKLLFIRRIKVGGETYFLCMDFFPARPVWMK